MHSLLQDTDTAEPLPDIALLDAKIADAILAMKDAETSADKRKAKERKEDLMRLKRVEQIYVSDWPHFGILFNLAQSAVLPTLSAWVLVLLKLLLATVSAGSNNQVPQSTTSSVFPPGVPSRNLAFHAIFVSN
jgi:hypothetical protein